MTTTSYAAVVTAPPPGAAPDLVPTMTPPGSDTEALLGHAVDEAMTPEDVRVGVVFDDDPRHHIYTYLAPPPVHVGSLVILPPSIVRPEQVTATVDTLDPPPYYGPVKRVVAVLS